MFFVKRARRGEGRGCALYAAAAAGVYKGRAQRLIHLGSSSSEETLPAGSTRRESQLGLAAPRETPLTSFCQPSVTVPLLLLLLYSLCYTRVPRRLHSTILDIYIYVRRASHSRLHSLSLAPRHLKFRRERGIFVSDLENYPASVKGSPGAVYIYLYSLYIYPFAYFHQLMHFHLWVNETFGYHIYISRRNIDIYFMRV